MTFFNIFSKQKIPQKEKIKIIVDNREKNSLVVSELINLDVILNFEQLEIGDYLINNTIIERKTKSDLIGSIIDKRIFSQIENMKKYPDYLLIIEENNFKSTINENVIRGFILSIALKSKVPIIFSKDEKETAKYLSVLANKKEKLEFSIRPNKTKISKEERVRFILEGFPNIGPVKAKELIKEFKSIKNIANATKGELEKILGKNAEEIYNLFNGLFDDFL